jgi:hypothetical protein
MKDLASALFLSSLFRARKEGILRQHYFCHLCLELEMRDLASALFLSSLFRARNEGSCVRTISVISV